MNSLAHHTLQAVIDGLAVGVITLDATGHVLNCNRWLSSRAGNEPGQGENRHITELFPSIRETRLEEAIEHALKDHLPSLLSPALHGSPLPLYQSARDRRLDKRMQQLIHVMPLPRDAEPAACLIQISDMTANVSRERLLRQQAETLRRTTNQDAQTGLANRRKFNETLNHEFRRALQAKQTLSLIVADIDGFAGYNDYYGRDQGDACLVDIAHVIQDVLKPLTAQHPLAARHGGDEFSVILPGVDETVACQIAENIRLRVGSLAIANQASTLANHLTLSLGVATLLPDDEADTNTLLSSVDVALYQAKFEGRNRAVFFSVVDGNFRLCT